MRPETEIDERRAVDVIDADCLAGFFVYEFAFQRLIAFVKDAQRFRFRDLVAAIRHVALGDIAHLLFDQRKIGFGQSSRRNYVIEKSVARIIQQRRPNSQFGSREKI